ncbi:MAG: PAS domain-containing protein, partial [Deltaproteobacteria bacterium]|nr:PAS domain-containing protein [Deltaproteobacteria bacterium]
IQECTAELQEATQQLEQEIEKRKRIERTLIETKAQLEHLLAASPASIYRCKLEDNYRPTFVSPNIKDQFGYETQQFLDDPDFWAGNIHPEDAPGVFADIPKIYERDFLYLE